MVSSNNWKCVWYYGSATRSRKRRSPISHPYPPHLSCLMIEPNTPLANILQKAKSMNTPERVDLLENSDELEAAHTSFSQEGQSSAPAAEENVETHYVALVKHVNPKTGKTMIYELDGRRLGPVERDELPAGEDLLGPTSLKIVEEFMKREMESGKQEFSLCALAPNLD
jgi:ubiquitin carboxyl-terminal hydrolase L3